MNSRSPLGFLVPVCGCGVHDCGRTRRFSLVHFFSVFCLFLFSVRFPLSLLSFLCIPLCIYLLRYARLLSDCQQMYCRSRHALLFVDVEGKIVATLRQSQLPDTVSTHD